MKLLEQSLKHAPDLCRLTESFETREVLPFEGNAPKPLVRPRRTCVTLERAMRLGKTPRCKGCAEIASRAFPTQMNAMKDSINCLNMKRRSRRRSDHQLPPLQNQQQCPVCSKTQMHVQLRIPNNMKRIFGNSMKISCVGSGSMCSQGSDFFTPVNKNVPFDSDKISSHRSPNGNVEGDGQPIRTTGSTALLTAAFHRGAGQV